MKRFIFTFLMFLGLTGLIFAHSDEPQKDIENILSSIKAEQGVKEDKNIDISKVKAKDLEVLGDAVMSLYIPNKLQHEFMDNMMGGEGSARLKNFHINIGVNYLASLKGESVFPFMGPGMMFSPFIGEKNIFGGVPMGMHWYYPWRFGFYGLGGFLMLILLVIAIIVIVYLLFRDKNLRISYGKTPLDILKERYAKGEITKEEFDKMKKDLL